MNVKCEIKVEKKTKNRKKMEETYLDLICPINSFFKGKMLFALLKFNMFMLYGNLVYKHRRAK